MKRSQAKHKFCRRIGGCIWGSPKCPSVKRPYPAGSRGKGARQKKLSTFGELLIEKQKLRFHYAISEKQLHLAYQKAKRGDGLTNEKLFCILETRLDAIVFRSGLAPSIFAAKQFVNHRHILVDGKIVDRASFGVKEGQTVSIDVDKSPSVAEVAKKSNTEVPSYLELEREDCKVKLARNPEPGEIPVEVEIMRVIEYYAR